MPDCLDLHRPSDEAEILPSKCRIVAKGNLPLRGIENWIIFALIANQIEGVRLNFEEN